MKFLFIILFSINMISLNAQEISSHKWKDRLLLVLAKNSEDLKFQEQLRILKDNPKGLEERKLVVYQILPEKFKKGLNGESQWQQGSELYQKFKSTSDDFEIILIGLDGGQKLKELNILSIQSIFSKIDSMPMRRAEMRDNNE